MLFLLGDAVIRAGVMDALLLAPWPLLALWCVYVSAFASGLTIDDEALTVQNLLRVIRMPWARVADIQWRWQVEITTDDGEKIRAVGGPVEGRGGRRAGSREETPVGMRAQYDSIVRAWETARQRLSPGADAAVRHGWDAPVVAALVVLIVWAVIAVLATGGPA